MQDKYKFYVTFNAMTCYVSHTNFLIFIKIHSNKLDYEQISKHHL
jgi:hypothetical protein